MKRSLAKPVDSVQRKKETDEEREAKVMSIIFGKSSIPELNWGTALSPVVVVVVATFVIVMKSSL